MGAPVTVMAIFGHAPPIVGGIFGLLTGIVAGATGIAGGHQSRSTWNAANSGEVSSCIIAFSVLILLFSLTLAFCSTLGMIAKVGPGVLGLGSWVSSLLLVLFSWMNTGAIGIIVAVIEGGTTGRTGWYRNMQASLAFSIMTGLLAF